MVSLFLKTKTVYSNVRKMSSFFHFFEKNLNFERILGKMKEHFSGWCSKYVINCLFFLCFNILFSGTSAAFSPEEILVVTNSRKAESSFLGQYYMKLRNIPRDNLIELPLSVNEEMTRNEYNQTLRPKVLLKINQLHGKISVLVLFHGVPLKIQSAQPSWEEMEAIRPLENKNKQLFQTVPDGNTLTVHDADNEKKRMASLQRKDERASVDSELMLVKAAPYDLGGWIRNPYFLGSNHELDEVKKDDVILVARLDGPEVKTVTRMIDDTLAAEKKGLQGKAYFDARWHSVGVPATSAYQRYDQSIHLAATYAAKRLAVVLDEKPQLFPEHSCPDAALYCGWYSLAHYIDSFTWQPGAIGYHIASSECMTLRDSASSLWCPAMLMRGAAAVIGPVNEPYVQGFPPPELFFGKLVEGYMSLGECYLVSVPYLSWQMVLVGDPLYQPFRPAPD